MIGLTGGSGVGKGAASAVLAARGFAVIDADAVYRDLCRTDAALLAALFAAFPAARGADGTLDRRALAACVFSDADALLRLNKLTTPFIRRAVEREAAALGAKAPVVLDAPTLFEAGFDDLCAVTVGVLAERGTRLARIMARDGLSQDAACARLGAQPDDAFYQTRCNYILRNNGDLAALSRQVDELIPKLHKGVTSNEF